MHCWFEFPRFVRGAHWTSDGRILTGVDGIQWVPADGGSPTALTSPDLSREVHHRLPWGLPGGQAILFTAMAHFWGPRARIEAISLAIGERKLVVEDAADARYLATGHLVFLRRGTLMAAPSTCSGWS